MGDSTEGARLLLAGCTVDLAARSVELVDGELRTLSPADVRLLEGLAASGGAPIARDALHQAVWGPDSDTKPRVVDYAVKRLRRKLERTPADPRSLLTVYGTGYQLAFSSGASNPEALPPESGAWPPERPGGPFVGRARDLERLGAAFAGGARLVTLLGPGGVGKTRLALELATRSYGALWVDLREARSGAEILVTLARGLGCQADAVQARLEGQGDTLIVLDNVEQIPDAVAVIDRLLRAPDLRLLVTSRALLGSPSERCVELAPLDVRSALALYEAGVAARREPLSARERSAARDLIVQLDGLPLAVELAAARSRLLGPGELGRRLAHRPEVLGGARDGGLEACVAWSWELLEAADRQLLTGCAVFHGGFDVDAVTEVLGLGDAAAADGLGRLQDRSLLTIERRDGATRLGMLFGIATFARRELGRQADAEALRERHATWCASRSETVAGGLRGPEHTEAVRALEAEASNVDAATAWALGAGNPALAARLLLAVAPLRLQRGAGRRWWDQVDDCIERVSDPGLRSRLLFLRGAAARSRGDLEGARADFEAGLPAAPQDIRNRIRRGLALLLVDRGEPGAREELEAVLEDEPPDSRLAMDTLFSLGFLDLREGRLDQARAAVARGEALARRHVDVLHEIYLLNSFHRLAPDRGARIGRLDRCIELAARQQMPRIEGDARLARAEVAATEARFDAADEDLLQGRRLLRRYGDRWGLGWAADIDAVVRFERGDLVGAEQACLRAEELFAVAGTSWAKARTAALRALVVLLSGRAVEAAALLGPEPTGASVEVVARRALVQGLLALPEAPERARACLIEAAEAAAQAVRPALAGRVWGLVARVARSLGDPDADAFEARAREAAGRWGDRHGGAALAAVLRPEAPAPGAVHVAWLVDSLTS